MKLCRRCGKDCGKDGGGWIGLCPEHRHLEGESYHPRGPIAEALSVGRFKGNYFIHRAMIPTKADLVGDTVRVRSVA